MTSLSAILARELSLDELDEVSGGTCTCKCTTGQVTSVCGPNGCSAPVCEDGSSMGCFGQGC